MVLVSSPPNTQSGEEVTKLGKDPVYSAGHKSHHGPCFCCEAVCVSCVSCVCARAQSTHTLEVQLRSHFGSVTRTPYGIMGEALLREKCFLFKIQRMQKQEGKKQDIKINACYLLDQEECYLKPGTNGFPTKTTDLVHRPKMAAGHVPSFSD